MTKAIDMTKGSPFKNIFAFAVPIALSFSLQHLYNLGDALIVSLSRGANAATGVNLTGTIVFLVLGFVQGLTSGFGIVLSQYVGAKDDQKIKNSIGTAIILSLIIGVILTVVTVPLARTFLELLKTDSAYIDYSTQYISVIFSGVLFTILYNYTDQIMRAMGDSKTPLFILIMCALLNIALNSLLFVSDKLTVAWAGWATIIAQAISAVVGFIVIYVKYPELRLKKEDFKFTPKFAFFHLGMGFPMAIQFAITASGCMVQQRAFNTLPDPLCAMAQGTASKIDNIFGSLLNGAGTAMATYVGQNYGAKDYGRIKKGYFSSLAVGAIFTVIAMALMMSLSVSMAKLLLPADTIDGNPQTVYDYVFTYAVLQSSFYYILFMVFQLRQCLQGIGRSAVAMFGGVAEFMARLLVAVTLAKKFGFVGACLSNPLAWLAGAVYLLISFIVCYNKMVKRDKEKQTKLEQTI